TLANTAMHQLKDQGFETRHTIVRYTSDEWKGKEAQLTQFPDSAQAKAFIGRRLIDVPDPQSELPSWVDRYWLDFGNYLDHFSRDVQIVSTHEIYTHPEMHELVRYTIEHREAARKIINKYRERNPYPRNWIPIDVVCEQCHRISTTTVLSTDLDAYTAEYRCDGCGSIGSTNIKNGKLSWRIEWAALWKVLDVGFEPFGKDHATPGGSRDSAKEIAEQFFKFKPPVPFAYEWVGLSEANVDKGDMGSSDFNGFTPKTWVSVAPGEALRYLYLKNRPMKRIVLGLDNVPTYIGQYERAERVYYGIDDPKAPDQEVEDIRRSYELAHLESVPKEAPIQIPYLHAVLLVQIIPPENLPDAAIDKLLESGIIPSSPSKAQLANITTRLARASTWVSQYAPPSSRIILIEEPPAKLAQEVTPKLRDLYRQLRNSLAHKDWTEHAITDAMKPLTQQLTKKEQHAFFRNLYQAFLGDDRGPRISAFLAFTDPTLVLSRLQFLAGVTE
ncbi:MAG: lysine--tRNA ligase, partial [Candidatus Hermodarchaeota archaeon]|nr:lysine--tRNA ligase [Candidatus Hermodarchaeota archaeon]